MHDYSGIEGLRFEEVPEPLAGPGEVLLKLHYAGLNPADRYLAEKQYPARPTFPHILGRDGMGTVVQLGEGVADIALGERRLIMRSSVGGDRPGTFAQFVAVPRDSLAPVPPGWTEQEAGGASLVYLTAFQALTMWGPLPHDAVILITGASGGVGVASIQLAVAKGWRVIALSRSPEKARKLMEMGAELVLNPNDSNWRQIAKHHVGKQGVNLAVDNIGGKLLPEVIDTLGQNGVVSLVGRLAGPVPSFNTATLFFRRLRLGGVAVGTYSAPESQEAWRNVLDILGETTKPLVDSVFPLAELPKAFARLSEGPIGKVLVKL